MGKIVFGEILVEAHGDKVVSWTGFLKDLEPS